MLIDVLVTLVLAVIAVPGGAPVVRAVFWAATPSAERRTSLWTAMWSRQTDDGVLRGGRWIGYLERLGIAATLLAGQPGGVAVIAGDVWKRWRSSSTTPCGPSRPILIMALTRHDPQIWPEPGWSAHCPPSRSRRWRDWSW